MLSRVADSLYWMGRYFERADHCARVLEANYNLLLNPSKPSREQRWHRITASLGLNSGSSGPDPQTSIIGLIGDYSNRSSMVSCMSSARENASQAREEISSEMWKHLNQLYHEMHQSSVRLDINSEPMPLITAFREGSFGFQGVTDSTMNHGEGFQFIQLGKFIERSCALSFLLDAYFSASAGADDLDWVALLSSCSAFEAYCKVYTADLKSDRVAEFLLLHPAFPYSVRYSAERLNRALGAIADLSKARRTRNIDRIVGKLRSFLTYVQIEEIVDRDVHLFLQNIIEQCSALHAAVHQAYIEYPIETALEA